MRRKKLSRTEFWSRVGAVERLAEVKAAVFPDDTPERRADRMAACILDSGTFLRTYCPHYTPDASPAFHDELDRIVSTARRAVCQAPRGHAKSTRITFGYTLYQVATARWKRGFLDNSLSGTDPLLYQAIASRVDHLDPAEVTRRLLVDDFIVISSATEPQAEEFTEAVKLELEDNLLLQDWGVTITDKGENYGDFTTPDKIRVKAVGLRASRRGMKNRQHRPSLWIVDDPDDVATLSSPEVRDKHFKRLNTLILYSVHPKVGRVFVVANVTHSECWVARLYNDGHLPPHEQRFPTWEKHCWRAIGDDGSILWEARYPRELLEEMRAADPDDFETEFQHRPPSVTGRSFPIIYTFDEADYEGRKLPTVLVMDPALGRTVKADFQAIVAASLDLERDWILIREVLLLRVTIPELRRVFLERYAYWEPDLAGIESVGFQALMTILIEEQGDEEGLFPSVVAIQQHESKELRIESLVPLNNRGCFRLAVGPATAGLRRQMDAWPEGKRDGLDGAEMAVRLLRRFSRRSARGEIRHIHRKRRFQKGAW